MPNLSEILCLLGITKKGPYQHFKDDCYIDNPRVEEIMDKIEKNYTAAWRAGALTVDRNNETGTMTVTSFGPNNMLGEPTYKWRANFNFSLVQNKTYIQIDYYDYEHNNARFSVWDLKRTWTKKFSQK